MALGYVTVCMLKRPCLCATDLPQLSAIPCKSWNGSWLIYNLTNCLCLWKVKVSHIGKYITLQMPWYCVSHDQVFWGTTWGHQWRSAGCIESITSSSCADQLSSRQLHHTPFSVYIKKSFVFHQAKTITATASDPSSNYTHLTWWIKSIDYSTALTVKSMLHTPHTLSSHHWLPTTLAASPFSFIPDSSICFSRKVDTVKTVYMCQSSLNLYFT